MVIRIASDSEVSSAERSRIARDKLGALIEQGRARGLAVIEQVESQQPHDHIILSSDLEFEPSPVHHGQIFVQGEHLPCMNLHRHALGQVADKAGLPRAYLSRLLEPENRVFGPELLAHSLTELIQYQNATDGENDGPGAFLLRAVKRPDGEEVRGFLSSRFRRLDSRPIIGAFTEAAKRVGAFPVDGYALETKIALKVVLGKLYEPIPGEVLAFGMALENSDYGNGALQVSFFVLRLACLNGMLMERSLRKVHLGSRLSANVVWSARTLSAETEATASAVHDLVARRLNDNHVRVLEEGIRLAHAQKIEPAAAAEYLKRHLLKAEAEAVTTAFNSPDIENLPAGQTKWRLAQAISFFAGQTEDGERRLELMRVAGNVVPVQEVG